MHRPIVSIMLLLIVFATVALAGCGQKGPLVRPSSSPAPAQSVPAPPAQTLPVPPVDDGSGG